MTWLPEFSIETQCVISPEPKRRVSSHVEVARLAFQVMPVPGVLLSLEDLLDRGLCLLSGILCGRKDRGDHNKSENQKGSAHPKPPERTSVAQELPIAEF